VPLALVIDDEETVRELVTLLLRQADCEVITAAEGVEGIRRLEESSPDFVILDVQMPGLDGWQTLKGIRARSDVPVVMLTAEATEQDKVRGLVGGADDYVTKPLAPAEFVARIQALLRRTERLHSSPPRSPGDGDDDVLPPGTEFGSYVIDDVVGRGGMSMVYRATHSALGRTVALKVMSEKLASDRVSRERFMGEWRIAAGLHHPNILPVHDAGEVGGVLFLAMDLIEGGDLGHLIARDGALSPPVAVRILEQVAAALDAAHATGLVHRDVKPGNVLLDGDQAFLTDFGLSKLVKTNGTRLTAPGRMVGTAEYLSPEQIRGEQVTSRTDVYALGCVIFETLTASSPFDAESDFVLMYAHLERAVPRLTERRPALPPALDAVVEKAMAKQADDRFESAGETVTALKAAFGYV
jgi:serine/threonine protein kinase/CheY-like chemotaxis protein